MVSRGFRIGLLAVFMLVLLRVSIGWHFLYAGIWKLQHPEFSSEGFLGQAKGPLAQEFYKLIPDIDGVERLEITLDKPKVEPAKGAGNKGTGKTPPAKVEAEAVKDQPKKPQPGKVNKDQMEKYFQAFVAAYNVNGDQLESAKRLRDLRLKQMDEFFKDHEQEFWLYKLNLEALHTAQKDPSREIPYQQERNWKQQTKLRKQAKGWLAERDQVWEGLESDLDSLLSDAQRERGSKQQPPEPPTNTPNHVDLLVTYSNVAIGACLIVGLFTRFASLAGALFLLQIVLAQPDWPGLYPPPPPSAGRTLIVGKEFIEMMAMFALAATPVGRWGGLDFLVHNLLIRPIFGKRD